VARVVEDLDGARLLELDDGRALVNVPLGSDGVGHTLKALYGSGLPLSGITVKEPNLEDLFLKRTGRELRD